MISQLAIDSASLAPLGRYPVLTAHDRDTLVAALQRGYQVRSVDFNGEGGAYGQAIANRVALPSLTLHYCNYSNPTHIEFGNLSDFRQLLCLTGAGEIAAGATKTAVARDKTGVISPGESLSAFYGAKYSQLVIQVSEEQVQRKAALLFGGSQPYGAGRAALTPVKGDSVTRLKAIALALALQHSQASNAPDLVRTELEQTLLNAFLLENRGLFIATTLPGARAGLADVSRLEDFILANWDRPLTIEDVAAACGVSVRSVFTRFKQKRGISPLTYIRNVRLDHARRLLLDETSALSVIDVAFKCGFASLGHFAKRYHDRFGELPSATLKRRA